MNRTTSLTLPIDLSIGNEAKFKLKLHDWIRKILSIAGPGVLVAVGYIDPGNWATDLGGGAAFGYSLLWVIFLSNLMALVLQRLSCKLGIVTGLDLAEACRETFSKPVRYFLWISTEIAICATDLAEVIGTAIALKLLFGLPLKLGVLITGLDVLLILGLQKKHTRLLEISVLLLMMIVFFCIGAILLMSNPEWAALASGFIPGPEIIRSPHALYLAIGILGATVMPHNLFLHSSIAKPEARNGLSFKDIKQKLKLANIDTTTALTIAFFINAAILAACASAFHFTGNQDVESLEEAHRLLNPLLGSAAASALFGCALLAAGQSSALTTTLAGQIVMEGFTKIRLAPWLRRLVTRSLAIVPAVIVTWSYGESATSKLLVLSQVILTLQLPFTVFPLLKLTADRKLMGAFANTRTMNGLAGAIALAITGAGLFLLIPLLTVSGHVIQN